MTHKIIGILVLVLATAALASSSSRLPPKYLSIEGFEACLKVQSRGTWTAYCMPDYISDACSPETWKQLNALTGADRVPDCHRADVQK